MSGEFVDTNVFVYRHDASNVSKQTAADELVTRLVHDRSGRLSMQVLQELFVTLARKIPMADARGIVAQLATWKPHAPSAVDILDAIDLHQRHKISFWDALIITSASALGCNVLWTEDLQDGRTIRGVKIRNPFA